jgi:hypothetical protein
MGDMTFAPEILWSVQVLYQNDTFDRWAAAKPSAVVRIANLTGSLMVLMHYMTWLTGRQLSAAG